MSDLVGNGGNTSGARFTPAIRTPRVIMAERNTREARRQAETERQRAEAQKEIDEERRRAAAVATERMSGPDMPPARSPEDVRGAGQTRQRSSSQTASQAPKVQSMPMPGHRRSQTTQSGARVSSAPNPAQSSQDETRSDEPQPRANSSSFPHAFERWEQLSSHWEGLTSYWLRKIDQNTDEIRRNVPSAGALSRQIQDLSAAGANLFHAVVELQRLRASSERKFQRWFFETREEQERAQESRADLLRQLQEERAAKEQALVLVEKANIDIRNADKRVHEVHRELSISKAEARRAWEDLGRRETEQQNWISDLRQGLPTVIGGVQVVPMHAASAGASHQGSERRPNTVNNVQTHTPQVQHQHMAHQEQFAEDEPSPTNTDPFTMDAATNEQQLHHEPDGIYQHYDLPGSTPASTSSTARTTISPQQQRQPVSPLGDSPTHNPPVIATSQPSNIPGPVIQPNRPTVAGATQDNPELFYQHPPGKVYLHSEQDPQAANAPVVSLPQASEGLRSQPSYGSGTSEGTEYEIDEHGQLRRDVQGRPIIFNRPSHSQTHARNQSQGSDDYDTAADVANEREMAARYGIEQSQLQSQPQPPTAPPPPIPTTSAQAMESYVSSAGESSAGYATVEPADYEGSGYGSWEALQSRHHHPTRLSDVLEEDERSRTTAE